MPTSSAPRAVDAVLFDYGLVLSGPPDPAAWASMLATLDTTEAPFHEAYWRPRHDYDRGTLNAAAYWHAVAAALDRTLSPTALKELIRADTALWTQPNQPMIDWASRLQRAGIRTGILSNLGDAMEDGILDRCIWLGDFDHHTFSHRLKIAKPELAIYAHAAAGLGTTPNRILFVDDRADNIAAAREAGMIAVQYLDHASFEGALQTDGMASLLHPLPSHAAPSDTATNV